MNKQPSLTEIVAKAEERFPSRVCGRGVKSPLYVWMHRYHADLQTAIDRLGWVALTKAVAEAGLANINGKPPPTETVRHTWWRVRRAVRLERAKAETSARKPRAVPLVQDALPPTPAQSEPEIAPDASERVRVAKERLLRSMNREA